MAKKLSTTPTVHNKINGFTRAFYTVLGVLILIGGIAAGAGVAYVILIFVFFGGGGLAVLIPAIIVALCVTIWPATRLALGVFKFKKGTPQLYNIILGSIIFLASAGLILSSMGKDYESTFVAAMVVLISLLIAMKFNKDKALFKN
ncbi:MAG: hypothetical protein AAB383_02350 [Patescibacteria group bacterium]